LGERYPLIRQEAASGMSGLVYGFILILVWVVN